MHIYTRSKHKIKRDETCVLYRPVNMHNFHVRETFLIFYLVDFMESRISHKY